MKKIIFCVLIFLVGINFISIAQQKAEKFFYKDTVFTFLECKIEVIKNLSTDKTFKTTLIITNPTDKFFIINPLEVFSFTDNSSNKYQGASRKVEVIPPNFTRKFVLRFEGTDFRESTVNIDFSKMQMTEQFLAVYELGDLDFSRENFREAGPVKFTIDDKDPSAHNKVSYKIMAKLEYTGGKFLGLLLYNINVKTKDGANYKNIEKPHLFQYNNSKTSERIILIFPLEPEAGKKENAPTISFHDVFREYTLANIEGFKIKLRQGNIDDYKGRRKTETKDDDGETD